MTPELLERLRRHVQASHPTDDGYDLLAELFTALSEPQLVDNRPCILVQAEDGRMFYVVERSHAKDKLPALAAQLDEYVGREGMPMDKFAWRSIPLPPPDDKRFAVMLAMYPPVELRDATLPQVEEVLSRSKENILRGIAIEVYKSFTSEPIDPTVARNLAEALTRGGG